MNARVQTCLNCLRDGKPLEQRASRTLSGVVFYQEKIRESLHKVKPIASKSEMNPPKRPAKGCTFSHFEVVGAFFSLSPFHILKSILYLGRGVQVDR